MAGLAHNPLGPLGPQPDFQRMSQLQHEYANEVGKIANVPQFQGGNAILAALIQINTRLGVIDVERSNRRRFA